jgi:tetratricopeptide (TPR) repeat protein
MIKYRFFKYTVVFLSATFFLIGCYAKDNFVHRNPYSGNISHQDVDKFLYSVRKVDGALETKYRMARHFQKRNKHKVALEELKALIQIDPTFVKAYNAMGFSYDWLGEFKKAIRFYKLALKIDPNLDYVYNNLGITYLRYGKYDSAIESFQKAIALNDQNPRFQNNLGFAYAKNGQYDQAIEQFRITGDEFSANYKLGQILYREGNYEMAFRYNEKAHHAKIFAKIRSSVSNSDKGKGSTGTLQVEENNGRSESSGVMSDYVRASLERDDVTPTAAMTGLSTNIKENKAPVDENARIKPVIVRKSIRRDPGLTKQQDQRQVRDGKLDLSGHKIDAAPTNHTDSSNEQLSLIAKNENLMNVAKNKKTPSNNAIIKVEIEVSNGNGVNGMAGRLGSYLRGKGFEVTRLANANSFSHEKTKIFYYNGHLQDVQRLLQEIPNHIDIKHIIELKQKGNRLKILIGKDMIPYDSVISRTRSAKNPS